MKKILILDSGVREGFTKVLSDTVCERLSSRYEIERITLRDEKIERCTGCCACLIAGSSHCPLKQDSCHSILHKLMQADGIVFLVPNYSLQVPGKLKDLLDRLAFVFHRPRLFHKVFLPLVVQGVFGGGNVCSYLNKVLRFWGCRTVKGSVLSGGVYTKEISDKLFSEKNMEKLNRALLLFEKELQKKKAAKPSLFQLLVYRSTRSSMLYFDEVLPADKAYFQKNGWNTQDYYYPVKLGVFKGLMGKLVDSQMKALAKKQKNQVK